MCRQRMNSLTLFNNISDLQADTTPKQIEICRTDGEFQQFDLMTGIATRTFFTPLDQETETIVEEVEDSEDSITSGLQELQVDQEPTNNYQRRILNRLESPPNGPFKCVLCMETIVGSAVKPCANHNYFAHFECLGSPIFIRRLPHLEDLHHCLHKFVMIRALSVSSSSSPESYLREIYMLLSRDHSMITNRLQSARLLAELEDQIKSLVRFYFVGIQRGSVDNLAFTTSVAEPPSQFYPQSLTRQPIRLRNNRPINMVTQPAPQRQEESQVYTPSRTVLRGRQRLTGPLPETRTPTQNRNPNRIPRSIWQQLMDQGILRRNVRWSPGQSRTQIRGGP